MPRILIRPEATHEDTEVASAAQYAFRAENAEIVADRGAVTVSLDDEGDAPLVLRLHRCVDATYRPGDPTSAAWFAMGSREIPLRLAKLCQGVLIRKPVNPTSAYLLLSRHSRQTGAPTLALDVTTPDFPLVTLLSVGFNPANPHENLWHHAKLDAAKLVLIGSGRAQAPHALAGLAQPIGAFLQRG